MKITRTYPQPDSPQSNLGPRERALNTFKYLLDLEPEQATKHPRFAVMVHAFEQSERRGWNAAGLHFANGQTIPLTKELDKSYCDLLSSTAEAEVRPITPTDFQPDGL